MPRKILSRNQQCYVVTRLACYALPSQVRDEIRDEFGLVITTNALQHYDPTKYQGHDLDTNLKDLFHTTRERYRHRRANIAIADQMHRLMLLENLAERAMAKDDIRLALAVLAQAAREMGGCYRRKDCIDQASTTMNLSSEEEGHRYRMAHNHEPESTTMSAPKASMEASGEEAATEESWSFAETTASERIEPEVTDYNPNAAGDEKWQSILEQFNEEIRLVYGGSVAGPGSENDAQQLALEHVGT